MRRKEAMRINTPDDWRSFFSTFLIFFHFLWEFLCCVALSLRLFSFTHFFHNYFIAKYTRPSWQAFALAIMRKLRKLLKLLLWTCIWTKCRATNISISHYSFAVNWFHVLLKWWNRKLFVSHFIYVYTGQATTQKKTTVQPLRNRLDNWLLPNFNTE